MASKAPAYIAFAVFTLAWSGTYLAVKTGSLNWSPLFLGGLRQSVAGGLILLWFALRGKVRIDQSDIRPVIFSGILITFLSNSLVMLGSLYISSGVMSLLFSTVPLFSWLLLIMSKKSRFHPQSFALFSLAFVGLWIALQSQLSPSGTEKPVWGAVLILAGAGFWALGGHIESGQVRRTLPFVVAGWQLLTGGILMLVLDFPFSSWAGFSWAPEAFWPFLYLVFIDAILGYGLYLFCLRSLPETFVNLFAYLNPAIALFLGFALAGEFVNGWTWAGLSLTLISVFFLSRKTIPTDQ
jgi:drug/metabolite transporter (DMT)-like permease